MILTLTETVTTASENAESTDNGSFVGTAVRLFLGVMGLLLLIYIIAELTPKLAKFIDEKLRKKPSEYEEINPETYEVRDVFAINRKKDKKADKKAGDKKDENESAKKSDDKTTENNNDKED